MTTIALKNANNGFVIGYVHPGSSNQELELGDKITLDNLNTPLQEKIALIDTINSSISTANTNITSLQSSVSTANTNISSLQSSVSTANTNISSLQSSVSTANTNITSLQSSVSTANTNISSLQSSVSTANTNISSLQSSVAALSGQSGISLDQTISPAVNMSSVPFNYFAKEWRQCTNSGTLNMIDMCCSGDGRVIYAGPWSAGSNQVSHNYGETWFAPTGLSSNIWSCCASLDGKYVVVSDFWNFKLSSNYGVSFDLPSSRPFQVQHIAVSATGKYIVCACSSSNGLQVSSDYGATWLQKETSTATWKCVATSLDGSVMYGCSDNGIIKKTTNNGSSWTTVYTDSGSKDIKSISCSGDGKYILVAFNSSAQLLLSANYGITFNSVGTSASYYKVSMSMNGTYMIGSVNGSALYYSIDNGANWSSVSNNQFCAIAMSYNGELIYNISPYNKVIMSKISQNVFNTNSSQIVVATAGSTYFDTATNKLYVYNGSAWKSVTLA